MLRKDSIFNFIYSIGAAIVILGALFKLTHYSIGPLTGNVMLAIGLITEAIIFVIFAFDPPKEEKDYAWENVHPELMGASSEKSSFLQANHAGVKKQIAAGEGLSEKLDQMLAEAKIDVQLFERFKSNLDQLAVSVEKMNGTLQIAEAGNRYNDQINQAATQLEKINALYAQQLVEEERQMEYRKKQVDGLEKSAMQSEKFNEELRALGENLNQLNRVYGGMLNAMKTS